MKHWAIAFAIAASLVLSGPAIAASKAGSEAGNSLNQSIWLGGRGHFSSWRAVGRDELILWASSSRPYLVKIWRPFASLRFAHTIGVTTTAGRVTTFEKVIVDGQRLPIKSIAALDRETAKSLRWEG